jgi:hypothetical protein
MTPGQRVSLRENLKAKMADNYRKVVGDLIKDLSAIDVAGARELTGPLTAKLTEAKDKPLVFNDGYISFLISVMEANGYSEDEVAFKYFAAQDIMAIIYETFYNGGKAVTERERLMASGLARVVSDKLDFIYSGARDDVVKNIKIGLIRDLNDKLKEPGLPTSRIAEIRKSLKEAEELTAEKIFCQEILGMAKALDIAKYMKGQYRSMGASISDSEAHLIGHNAVTGVLNKKDIENWMATVNMISDSMKKMGITLDKKLIEKIIYTADNWLELGVSRLPKLENYDQKDINRVVDDNIIKELAARGIIVKDEDRTAIIRAITDKNIDPAVMVLLAEDAIRHEAEIKQAIIDDKNRSVWGAERAPRLTYDLAERITLKDIFVYLDENNPYPDEHIGLSGIFKYEKDSLERQITSPITAMLKMREDELLKKIIPEDVRQKNWSVLEKARFRLYESMQENKNIVAALLVGAILMVMGAYAFVYKRLSGSDRETELALESSA